MSTGSNETIMCVEDSFLAARIGGEGFVAATEADLLAWLPPEAIWFAPRAAIEHRPDFRQIVPYIVVRYENAVVAYRRTPHGDEPRLFDRLSIGIGGHIRLQDSVDRDGVLDVRATINRAAMREFEEEIDAQLSTNKCVLGVIYDRGDAVNSVHLGIVEMWDLASAQITLRESSLAEHLWLGPDDIASHIERMEGWSVLVAGALKTIGVLSR